MQSTYYQSGQSPLSPATMLGAPVSD